MTGNVTQLIRTWRAGSPEARDELIELVYEELKRMAADRLRGERPGHTLSSTALVHEAYARLVSGTPDFSDRAHFFAVAATTMRRVLVDHARARNRAKRGGGRVPVTLVEGIVPGQSDAVDDLLTLDEALERLAERDPRKGRLVELHYFGGLTHAEMAEAVGISTATVDRDLRMARAWLTKEMGGGDD